MPAVQSPPPPVDERVDGDGVVADEDDDVSKDVFLNKQND